MDMNLQIIAAVQDVFPEKTGGLGLGNRLFQDFPARGELTANVEVGQLHPVGEAAEDHPLKKLVRILVNDLPILERAGLRFVRIADEINRFGDLSGINEAPLHSGGEAGTSPAPELTLLHLISDGICALSKPLLKNLVTPVFAVTGDIRGVAVSIHIFQNQTPFFYCHGRPTYTPRPARSRAPHPLFRGSRRYKESPAPFRRTPGTPRIQGKIFHLH